MQRPRAVGVVIVSLMFASSWGASIRAADEEEGSFQGEIMHVKRADEKSSPKGFLGTVLVEKERKPAPDKISFAVTEKTSIFRRIGGFRVPASFKSLKKGQQVRVKFSGPVLTSYPAKARAREIEITLGGVTLKKP